MKIKRNNAVILVAYMSSMISFNLGADNLLYYAQKYSIYGYNLTKSMFSFYPSFSYNRIMFGNEYKFSIIISGEQSSDSYLNPSIRRDQNGKIISIDDGISTPILLSGIPYAQHHIDALFQAIELKILTIYSFNLDFERRWSNWDSLMKANQNIYVELYPTVDYSAPSMVDMVRLADDLAHRLHPSLVQCKAGRGRSATALGAYLMLIAFQAGDQVEIDEIEKYLQTKRPRVEFNSSHRQALAEFRIELIQHMNSPLGLLASISEKFKESIELRKREIQQNYALIARQD